MMRRRGAAKLALLIVGAVVGVLATQLIWPLVTAAQGGGAPSFVMQTTIASHAARVRAFSAAPPDLSPAKLQGLTRAFGMTGTPSARGGGNLGLDQGGKCLRINGASGAILYMDTAKLGTLTPKALPAAAAGGAAADRFVRDNALLPPEASQANVQPISMLQIGQGRGAPASVPVEMQVNYGFALNGKAVMGPGAKASVFLGQNGEVIGFNKAWRDVSQGREVATRNGSQAFSELQRSPRFRQGGVRNVRVTKMVAGYWAEDIGRGAVEVAPAYIFEGVYQTADGQQIPFVQKIPADAAQTEPVKPVRPQPPRPQE
jgi:hypothetical protein